MPEDFESIFIGGRRVRGSADDAITLYNASTRLPLGQTNLAAQADVDNAVSAARAAVDSTDGWASWSPIQRSDALRSLADELDKRGERTAEAVSSQNGMPIATSRPFEGGYPAVILRYYAQLILDQEFERTREHFAGGSVTVVQEPLGVIAAIAPWNFPQVLGAFKFAPALAAGCSVVLKPSPQTLLDSVVLAEAVAASDLPDGVLNIVPGGADVGAYLVEHPGINKVSFTGSTAAGRLIGAACGRLIRPVTLELGGKSAAIFLDDVELDLEAMSERLYAATMLNSGQSCFLGTRILVPRSRYDDVVCFFEAFLSSLPIGDALDAATRIGPMATAEHRDRVENYIGQGREEARLVMGGGRPAGVGDGWFVEPTLFVDVAPDAVIAQEEIFGPVLSVIAFGDDEEAAAIANNSRYGLGGSIWTSDPDRGQRLARRVQTGTIGINRYRTDLRSPFGGVKDSGLGREMGPGALQNYQQPKSIYF